MTKNLSLIKIVYATFLLTFLSLNIVSVISLYSLNHLENDDSLEKDEPFVFPEYFPPKDAPPPKMVLNNLIKEELLRFNEQGSITVHDEIVTSFNHRLDLQPQSDHSFENVKTPSNIDFSLFDRIGQGLMEAIVFELEANIGDSLSSLGDGYDQVFNFSIGMDTKLGLKLDVDIHHLHVTVASNVVGIVIDTQTSGGVKLKSIYGNLGLLDLLYALATPLGITPDLGGSLRLFLDVEFNKADSSWSVNQFNGELGFFWIVKKDFIKLFISAFAPVLLPLYEAANFASNALFGFALSHIATGHLNLSCTVGLFYNSIQNAFASQLDVDLDFVGKVNIDNKNHLEANLTCNPHFNFRTNASNNGLYIQGRCFFPFVININLSDIIPLIPGLNFFNEVLTVTLGIHDLTFLLEEQLLDFEFGPIKVPLGASSEDKDGDGLTDFDESNGVFGYVSDPNTAHTDGDGLTDLDEIFAHRTDPASIDTDGDGLSDFCEVEGKVMVGFVLYEFSPTDPLNNDTDGDWLSDYYEVLRTIGLDHLPTNPHSPDSDGDGISDYQEDRWYLTNPKDANSYPLDSDQDGLYDKDEDECFGTSKTTNDTDNDLLSDYDEIYTYLTDGSKADSDSDGLSDGVEVLYQGTDPKNPDTDEDGLTDGSELNTHSTNPLNNDTDQDGMLDGWEVRYQLNPRNSTDAEQDRDNDGLTNLQEFNEGTNPNNADSDSDGLSDGDEVLKYHTKPLVSDSDGDGYTDGEEVTIYGTDPNNPDSRPLFPFLTYNFLIGLLLSPLGILGVIGLVIIVHYVLTNRRSQSPLIRREDL
ncbi:MAG: binary toxin-like calcium binding domain-containing protein [Candidatus Hermodarchaeota archaeon]